VKKIEDVDSKCIRCIHAGVDGLLYTYGGDGVKIWDKDLKMTKKIPLPSDSPPIGGAFVTTNSCYIFTTDDRSKLQVYNKATAGLLRDFNLGGSCPNYLAVNETHAVVAPGCEFVVIDLDSMQEIKKTRAISGITTVALHGNHLIIGTIDNVDVYDMTSWEVVKHISLEARDPQSMLVDGDFLYIGAQSAILVIDLKTYKQVAKMEGHNGIVRDLVKCGNTLFSAGSSDQTLKMWDVTRHGLVNSVTHDQGYTSVDIWNGQLVSSVAHSRELWVSIWG